MKNSKTTTTNKIDSRTKQMPVLPESIVLNKDSYEISSPEGMVSFLGINKITKDRFVRLKFTNGSELKCSEDHPIVTIEGMIKAKDINKTTEVKTKTGGCFVVSKRFIRKTIDLYDIVDSGTQNLYYSNGIVSHNCEFIGSQNTLIEPNKLKCLSYRKPFRERDDGLKQYIEPKEGRSYFMSVDVSRGAEIDYHVITVIDITEMPYRICAVYRNNTLAPMILPTIVNAIGHIYNKAWCLVEINDIGGQVADILYNELEYENIMVTSVRGRKGQTMDGGFGSFHTQLGVRTSPAVKKLGCGLLKDMIESDKLIIEDYDMIQELSAFVAKKGSYEAETGHHDDTVMTLVLFAWCTSQNYFKDLTDLDIRSKLYQEKIQQIEEDLAPFGFIDDGLDEQTFVDNEGTRWSTHQSPHQDDENNSMGW